MKIWNNKNMCPDILIFTCRKYIKLYFFSDDVFIFSFSTDASNEFPCINYKVVKVLQSCEE